MVWFQCEDCGENLKKPKLANHLRGCSATKFSCIDCGVVFNQQTVHGHTQCVSEAEKYGPKTTELVKKGIEKTLRKENDCDGLDSMLGLSTRAPWSCSLCNIKATSQETLLLHSQGKKHKTKVKAQSFKETNVEDAVNSNLAEEKRGVSVNDLAETECHKSKEKGLKQKNSSEKGMQLAGASHEHQSESNSKLWEKINNNQRKEKKHKRKMTSDQHTPDDFDSDKHTFELPTKKLRTVTTANGIDEEWIDSVRWNKLIKKALKDAPTGFLKFKQLRSLILPSVVDGVKESGFQVDEAMFSKELKRQIQSSTKYIVEGRKVSLAV